MRARTSNRKAHCCSETDTEGDDCLSNHVSNRQSSPTKSDSCCSRPCNLTEIDDDVPLISFCHSKNLSPKMTESVSAAKCNGFKSYITVSPQGSSKASGDTQTVPGRKYARIILYDEEEEEEEEEEEIGDVGCSKEANLSFECVATSNEAAGNTIGGPAASPSKYRDALADGSKFTSSSQNPVNLEENICSFRSYPRAAPQTGKDRSL